MGLYVSSPHVAFQEEEFSLINKVKIKWNTYPSLFFFSFFFGNYIFSMKTGDLNDTNLV